MQIKLVVVVVVVARIIINHDKGLLQFTTGTLYKSRQLLLQFTTGITIHDNCYYNTRQVLQFTTLLQFTTVQSGYIRSLSIYYMIS